MSATNIYGEDVLLTTIDADSIYKTVITALENSAGEPLYPGDERRIYGEGIVALFVALYNTMNDVGRQTLLRYARGEVLDAIGERLGVKRLPGDNATTIIRFSVSTPRSANIIIPKWTKVTADGENYFATDAIAVLQAGTYSVDVPTSAVGPGTKFNGYAVGTITTLVDLIPYVENVTNVTETAGGDDGEPYTTEGDDRLRERIRLAPAQRSTAGSELSYVYWAMSADGSIADVKAVSDKETVKTTLATYAGHAFMAGPLDEITLVVKANADAERAILLTDYDYTYEDYLLNIRLYGSLADAENIYVEVVKTHEGCIELVPLLKGGQIPDEAMLEKVLETVNAADVRAMTDHVTVVAPEVIPYDVELVYYCTPDTEAEVIANVEYTDGAINRFSEWQSAALGRDINPDKLRALILAPNWAANLTGAIRVDIVQPAHTELTDTQVAKFSGNLKVSHKTVTGVV